MGAAPKGDKGKVATPQVYPPISLSNYCIITYNIKNLK